MPRARSACREPISTGKYASSASASQGPGKFTMKIVRPRIVGFAIVCLAFWQVPSAQAQLTAPREAAQLQFGPLSIYPSLRVVDVGIDDNVFNDTVAEQDDYTFTIASRVMGVFKMGANELMASVGGDYVWFKDYVSQ